MRELRAKAGMLPTVRGLPEKEGGFGRKGGSSLMKGEAGKTRVVVSKGGEVRVVNNIE